MWKAFKGISILFLITFFTVVIFKYIENKDKKEQLSENLSDINIDINTIKQNERIFNHINTNNSPVFIDNNNNTPYIFSGKDINKIKNLDENFNQSLMNSLKNQYEKYSDFRMPEKYFGVSSINDLIERLEERNIIGDYQNIQHQIPNQLLTHWSNNTERGIYVSILPFCGLDEILDDNYSNKITHDGESLLFNQALSIINKKSKLTIDNLYDDNIKKLNENLYFYYLKGHFDMPIIFIDISDGCGAGEVQIMIETNPKGGKVYYIPTFLAETCLIRQKDTFNIDFKSNNSCEFWEEVNGNSASVAGRYFYQVIHNDIKQIGKIHITDDDTRQDTKIIIQLDRNAETHITKQDLVHYGDTKNDE